MVFLHNVKREIILSGLGWVHLPFHVIERELSEAKLETFNFDPIFPRQLDIFLIKSKKYPVGQVGENLWSELSALHVK